MARIVRRIAVGTASLALIMVAALVAAFVLIPSPIGTPVAWQPEPLPAAVGPLAPNSALENADLIGDGELTYPEDLVFDEAGRLYTGTFEGAIWRITLDEAGRENEREVFAQLGARGLGLQFDAAGSLLVAAPDRGLLAVDASGDVAVLTDSVDGSPITYANELAIASDGIVYFTDSSDTYDAGWPYDFLEGRPHGRVLSYDPSTNTTRVVADELYFPNGIAVAPGDEFLVVAETFRNRLLRIELGDAEHGEVSPFATNLPVGPDNITLGRDGSYWIGGGGGPRTGAQDFLQSNALAKEAAAKLIPYDVLRGVPAQQRYGYVLRLHPDGTVMASYHDRSGGVHTISSAVPSGDRLFLATLYGSDIGVVPLPQP